MHLENRLKIQDLSPAEFPPPSHSERFGRFVQLRDRRWFRRRWAFHSFTPLKAVRAKQQPQKQPQKARL